MPVHRHIPVFSIDQYAHARIVAQHQYVGILGFSALGWIFIGSRDRGLRAAEREKSDVGGQRLERRFAGSAQLSARFADVVFYAERGVCGKVSAIAADTFAHST